jgi:hypothetical protein
MTTLIPKYDIKNGGLTPTGAINRAINEKLSDFISVKDFGAVGDGTTDDTTAIQNAIDYASNLYGNIPAAKQQVATVYFPSGNYLVSGTLENGVTDPRIYCNLEGIGIAEITYTGTAECLYIGANSSFGVTSCEIKNLTFSRADRLVGTTAIYLRLAGYVYIENVGINNFDDGIHLNGCIGVKINGKRRWINSRTCITSDSSNTPASTRFANNLLEVTDLHLGDGATNGFLQRVATGAIQGGSGGVIKLSYIIFEGFAAGGTSIYVQENGEVSSTINQLDTVQVDHCWFEAPGTRVAMLSTASIKFEYCFFGPLSVGQTDIVYVENNYCTVWFDQCFGYQLTIPLVNFAGTVTDVDAAKARIHVGQTRGANGYPLQLFTGYPVNTLDLRTVQHKKFAVQYNSTYPAGNVNSNALLTLNLVTEAFNMFGSNWSYFDVTFMCQANVSAANAGHVSIRIYNTNLSVFYPVTVIDAGTSTAYTLTGTSIQFGTGATSVSWEQMIGVWDCNTVVGQY